MKLELHATGRMPMLRPGAYTAAMDDVTIIAGEAVFPVSGPPVSEGAVAVGGGKVLSVGPTDDLRRAFGGAQVTELRGCVITPGLVNAHCHLELSDLRGRFGPSGFVEWVIGLMGVLGVPGRPRAQERVRTGAAESLAAGVTTVGDVSRETAEVRRAAAAGKARVVAFAELTGMGARRKGFDGRLSSTPAEDAGSKVSAGLSPHAPYSVEGPILKKIVAAATQHRLPLCMHVAELASEGEFLATLGGELRGIWDALGGADAMLDGITPKFAGGPIRWARHWGLLPAGGAGVPVVLAHVNYADDEEIEIVRAAGASVVYCPRTRAFFGHDAGAGGAHRFREMLARGVNVCLGTDSLASNPDLAVLREAQYLLKKDPTLPPESLLEMVTSRGARALGRRGVTGTLEAGVAADIAVFPISNYVGSTAPDMLRDLIASAPQAAAVWIGGEKVL